MSIVLFAVGRVVMGKKMDEWQENPAFTVQQAQRSERIDGQPHHVYNGLLA